jgi:hypothetical protein
MENGRTLTRNVIKPKGQVPEEGKNHWLKGRKNTTSQSRRKTWIWD